jgi:hypothetical protein
VTLIEQTPEVTIRIEQDHIAARDLAPKKGRATSEKAARKGEKRTGIFLIKGEKRTGIFLIFLDRGQGSWPCVNPGA